MISEFQNGYRWLSNFATAMNTFKSEIHGEILIGIFVWKQIQVRILWAG